MCVLPHVIWFSPIERNETEYGAAAVAVFCSICVPEQLPRMLLSAIIGWKGRGDEMARKGVCRCSCTPFYRAPQSRYRVHTRIRVHFYYIFRRWKSNRNYFWSNRAKIALLLDLTEAFIVVIVIVAPQQWWVANSQQIFHLRYTQVRHTGAMYIRVDRIVG